MSEIEILKDRIESLQAALVAKEETHKIEICKLIYKNMNIDTEFNVGDSVCYLSGDNIYHSTISKISIEISHEDRGFLMVYKLSDGLSVPRNNYPQWDKRLFRDKDSLIKYLLEE